MTWRFPQHLNLGLPQHENLGHDMGVSVVLDGVVANGGIARLARAAPAAPASARSPDAGRFRRR